MSNPLLVNAEQIDSWSEKIESSSLLPELVQRLMLETDRDVNATFRTNGGTRFSGWDGKSASKKRVGPIPRGTSFWEVSVNKSTTKKANSDYATRTKDTPEAERSKLHYICVTSRKWSSRDSWEESKNKLNDWKSVLALDGEALYSWLIKCPSTHLWLTELISGSLSGVESLESSWDRISKLTKPNLTEELILIGRDNERDSLIKSISAGAELVTLRVSSFDEAISFVYAALAYTGSASDVSRCLVTSDFSQLKRVIGAQTKLVFLAPSEVKMDQNLIKERSCTVVRITLPGEPEVDGQITIPPQSRYKLADKFSEMGLDHDQSQRLGYDLRKGFLYFQKTCAIDKVAIIPSWRNRTNFHVLLTIALVQVWRFDSDVENALVAEIAGISLEELEKEVATLKLTPDSCIREKSGQAYCISPTDVFDEAAGALTHSFLNRYFAVAERVLYTPNPLSELDQTSLFSAQFQGVRPEISERFTNGILNGLALLGTFGDSERGSLSSEISNKCYSIVKEILDDLGAEPIGVRRASHWLKLLAECSPEAFVNHFSEINEFEGSVVESWFEKAEDGFFSSPLRTEFLFALEIIAWSPDFFFRAVQILARLCSFKIEDNWGNQPVNTLKSLFLYWYPCTSADVESRVSALNWLYRFDPKLAVNLIEKCLPFGQNAASPTAKPDYRLWYEGDRSGIARDSGKAWEEMSALFFDWATGSIDGNLLLVGRASVLGIDQLSTALMKLTEQVAADELEAVRVYEHLYKVLNQHEDFDDADWNMGVERRGLISQCILAIEPMTGFQKYKRIFKNWLRLPHARDDFEGHDKMVAKLRTDVVKKLLDEFGEPGLIELAKEVESPYLLGVYFFEATRVIPESIVELLNSKAAILQMCEGLLGKSCTANGFKSVVSLLESPSISIDGKCVLLRVLTANEEFYEILKQQPSELVVAFWKTIGRPRVESEDDLLVAMTGLESVKRPFSALQLSAWEREDSSVRIAECIARLLELLATEQYDESKMIGGNNYVISQCFKKLYDANLEPHAIARLEFMYYRFLERSDQQPRHLLEVLGKEPNQLVELARKVYRSSRKEEIQAGFDSHAYGLLHVFEESGKLFASPEKASHDLVTYITQARILAKDYDLVDLIDSIIGQAFARARDNESGLAPVKSVCDAIEQASSNALLNGLSVGLFNSRGIHGRELDSGGGAERLLADNYDSAASLVNRECPQVASVLRDIAKSYRADSKREDDRSDFEMDFGH